MIVVFGGLVTLSVLILFLLLLMFMFIVKKIKIVWVKGFYMFVLEIYIDICLKDVLIDYLFEKGFDDFFYVECYKYVVFLLFLS